MPSGAYQRASRRAALSAFGLVFAGLLAPALFGFSYQGVDLLRVDAGLLCAIRERLRAGDLPLLSPLLENGGPLFARPDAQLLYPPRLLAAALPVDLGLAFEVAFHLALAALGTAWLLRTFRVRPLAACCGGIAFALCGTCVDLVRHGNYLVAAPWLPLVWAAARRGLQRRGRGWHVLAIALSMAMMLLGAEPQTWGVAAVVVAVEIAAALVRRRRSAAIPAARLAAAAAASVALGWMQWGPTWAELALTPRQGNLHPILVLYWSYGPPLWIGTLLPGMPSALVQPYTSLFQAWMHPSPVPYPWNLSPYLGPLVVAGAICGLSVRRAATAIAVFVGSLIFSLGGETPLFPLVMKLVPLVTRFRFPSKYLVCMSLAAVVLAALAFDRAERSKRARRALLAALGVASLALIATAIAVGVRAEAIDQAALRSVPEDARLAVPGLPLLSTALRSSALRALGPLLAALGVLAFAPRLRKAAFVLVAADVALAAPLMLQVGPSLLEVETPLARLASADLGQRPVLCVHPGVHKRAFGLGFPLREMESNLSARVHLAPELGACEGVASGMTYSPLEPSLGRSVMNLYIEGHKTMGARALGCTHLLVDEEPAGDGARLLQGFQLQPPGLPALRDQALQLRVYELDDPLPPAFVARGAALHGNERSAAAAVGSASGRDDLMKVVDDPLGRLQAAALPAGDAAAEAKAVWRSPHEIEVATGGSGAAVIAVRSAFLVGWSAAQAGQAVPVVRVAGSHLGAVVADVAAGPVVFTYRVPALTASLFIGLAGLAIAMAAAFVRRSRRAP